MNNNKKPNLSEVIGRYFKYTWLMLVIILSDLMTAYEHHDAELRQQSIHRLTSFFLRRALLWGIPAVPFAIFGYLTLYVELVAAVYLIGAFLAWCTVDTEVIIKPPEPPQPPKPRPSDAFVLKIAKQGLENLLDIVLVVARQVSSWTAIECPQTKGLLAYPNKNKCLKVQDGVAILSVRFRIVEEVEPLKFLELFNECLSQMLNAYELPGHPAPIVLDWNNVPHTSIQAINCIPMEGYIVLEVIRVTPEAIPMLDELERNRVIDPADEELFDDEL